MDLEPWLRRLLRICPPLHRYLCNKVGHHVIIETIRTGDLTELTARCASCRMALHRTVIHGDKDSVEYLLSKVEGIHEILDRYPKRRSTDII